MTHRHVWIAMTDCSARCAYIDDEHNYCTAKLSKEEVDRRLRAIEFLSAEDAKRIALILEHAEEYFLVEDLDNYVKALRGE